MCLYVGHNFVMSGVKEAFPFAPLGETEVSMIAAACGGEPPILDGFRQFLAFSRELAIPEGWYRRYLTAMGRRCLGALDMASPEALLDSNRGALLYAGATIEAGVLRPLPRDSEVLLHTRERDPTNVAIDAIQAAADIPSFGGLLERFGGFFIGRAGYNGLDAARVGAGLLHAITASSVTAAEEQGMALSTLGTYQTVAEGVMVDDGLRDLMQLFDNTEWPE